MSETKIFSIPEGNGGNGNGGIDAGTLLAASALGGGGFGGGFGGMNPLWMMFMWPLMYPFLSMFGGGYGGFGGFGGNGGFGNVLGTGYLSNQLNNDLGRDLVTQAVNGRADALGQLAQLSHNDINSVRDAISTVNAKLSEFGAQFGLTSLQVISELKSGNAALAQQLCQCCCDNRIETLNQTNALQSQAAANASAAQLQLANHDASVRLQLAQNEAADQLSVCQQTNQLGSQADRNTNITLGAIADLKTAMTKEFCDIRERELQDKVNTQGDIITQLRGQIDNDRQTAQLYSAIAPIQARVNEIANKQPNTVPVQWPNLTAVNNTPYAPGAGFGYGYGWGNGWNGSFWG